MSVYLTKIQINKVFHLENISIELDSQEKKHLILTGKNGSGKTSVLNRMADFFQNIKDDNILKSLGVERLKQQHREGVKTFKSGKIYDTDELKKSIQEQIDLFYDGHIILYFTNFPELIGRLQLDEFLVAFYPANRKTKVLIPRNPDKPNLTTVSKIKDSKIGEFLRFLVDLKVQEALARNENQDDAADGIRNWFISLTRLLQKIFENEWLSLDFNYKDYSFTINLGDRQFGFNELADGYSSIIDIVADLIIKMQDENSLTYAYEKEGIVLIDEVETHLHLKLQRSIMPMLAQIFPNIQFIVTTHSPFVLSSLKNAVAFDLEKQTRLEDLTEYSYEALAEGYFRVETESSFLLAKLEKFKQLAEIPQKDSAELAEFESLNEEFSSMDDALVSPNIKGQYLQIKLSEK